MVFVEVKSVAKDKFIGDGKAKIVNGDIRFAALGFIQQGADFETILDCGS